MSALAYFVLFSIVHSSMARYDRLSIIQQLLYQSEDSTCYGSNHRNGCCTTNSCTSADRSCFCDELCYEYGDCCDDIMLINCFPTTIPPPVTNCATAGHTNGCCTGGPSNCSVIHNSELCYCDVSCYVEGSCCEDIAQIACHPHNCTEAGKLGCHVNETENEFCAVTTSEGVCYCDSTCVVNGTCCDDAEEMFRPVTTATPPPITNCMTANHTNGCCNGGPSNCFVELDDGDICYCDVTCYSETSCCDDIQQINCYPQNCREAGKLGCVVNEGENCAVNTGNDVCYCDANCMEGTADCCGDAMELLYYQSEDIIKELFDRYMRAMFVADIEDRRNMRRRYLAHLAMMMESRSRKTQKLE